MTVGIPKSKPPEWEVRDLFDGRIGLFRFGLCVRVFRTAEELGEYTRARSVPTPLNKNLALKAAIRKL